MDHHVTVRTALNLLKPRLEAFLHSRLRACFGAAYLGRERRLAERPDTQALLSILLDHWQGCLAGALKPSVRSIAHELKAARNLWAHEDEITWDQAYRCLDNVQLMLHAIGSRDADPEIERIKGALRGLDRVDPPAPPPSPPLPPPPTTAEPPGEFGSFEAFVRGAVLPHRERHPEALRLDGRTNGGNRQVFGRFWHAGELWRVNADTRFEPLLIAYENRQNDPFVEVQTSHGRALELREDLQAARETAHKHLYIYADGDPRTASATPALARGRATGSAVGTAAEGRRLLIEELRRRGVEVSEHRDGNLYSLEMRHPGNGQRIRLRVKSRRSGTCQGRASDGSENPKPPVSPAFWVFVDLGSAPAAFHIVPEEWIRRDIHEAHQKYLDRHGGRRAITQESDHHAIQPARIRAWKGRWDLLGL